jgi:hypothetical protein
MGSVEVYEYNLGLCILHILVYVTPKNNNYDDKYIMGTFWFKKNDSSFETLTMETTLKMIKYLNIFIHGENDFVKSLIKKETFDGKWSNQQQCRVNYYQTHNWDWVRRILELDYNEPN